MGRTPENEEHVKARGGRTNASQTKSLELPASFPMMPPGIKKAQKIYWNYFCDLMLSAKILTTVDAQALYILCDECAARDMWYDIRDKDMAQGNSPMYETPNGTWTVKPYINAITKIHADIKVSQSKLGLDPKARVSLKPAEGGDKKKSGRTGFKKR